MSGLMDAWSVLLVSVGVFFFFAGTVGLLRFPDILTRLHALTKADNLGLGLIVVGLLPQVDDVWSAAQLLVIWWLILVSGTVVSQRMARLVQRTENTEGGGS